MKDKYRRISEYPDTWSVLDGVYKDKIIIVRFREGLLEAVGHPDFPFQIGIAVPLLNPTLDGLPSGSESSVLDRLENRLEESLTNDNQNVLALVLTTGGMREFVFYASERKSEFFEKKINEIQNSIDSNHRLQFIIQDDKDWDTFRSFAQEK